MSLLQCCNISVPMLRSTGKLGVTDFQFSNQMPEQTSKLYNYHFHLYTNQRLMYVYLYYTNDVHAY